MVIKPDRKSLQEESKCALANTVQNLQTIELALRHLVTFTTREVMPLEALLLVLAVFHPVMRERASIRLCNGAERAPRTTNHLARCLPGKPISRTSAHVAYRPKSARSGLQTLYGQAPGSIDVQKIKTERRNQADSGKLVSTLPST
jgi:hypothetical protein